MKVQQVSSTNFSAKQRFLNDIDLENFRHIKKKIGNGSVLHCDDMFWYKRIGYLATDNVFFTNSNPTEVLLGKSKVVINDDGSFEMSKPLFKTKSGLIRKLGIYLSTFNNMFDIPNVIEKKYLLDTGYIDESDGKAYITKREWVNSK